MHRRHFLLGARDAKLHEQMEDAFPEDLPQSTRGAEQPRGVARSLEKVCHRGGEKLRLSRKSSEKLFTQASVSNKSKGTRMAVILRPASARCGVLAWLRNGFVVNCCGCMREPQLHPGPRVG